MPAQAREFGDVRAIWPRRVENKAAAVADDVGDESSKLGDGNVLSRADIEEFGPGILPQDKDASIGKVINGKKFPARSAGAQSTYLATDISCHAASALSAARGFLATMVNNERAAGSGKTRPCSQLRSVASGILSALANSVCVM